MKNYSIANEGLVNVKPYNTNRIQNKLSFNLLLAEFASGDVSSERELVRFARKVLNVNKTNRKIDENEMFIKQIKEVLLNELEVGDYGTKDEFVDVMFEMLRDHVICVDGAPLSLTTVTYLALDDLVNEGFLVKKRMRDKTRSGYNNRTRRHNYHYETVYECVK